MTVYALLVGIDQYASPQVRDLNGCVRDVENFREFLKARVIPEGADLSRDDEQELADAGGHLELKLLRNEQATWADIVGAFRQHLGQAQNDDVALFYYSGHGSQEQAPPEFWEVEPDKLNETLVCHDSRMPDKADAWDLADKELATLIGDMTQGKPNLHTVVILDACHSGSGTRDVEEGVRLAPTDQRERPRDSYLEGVFSAAAAQGQAGNWYSPPEGKHLLLAACRPEEVARERVLEGEMRGVFSYQLLNALTGAGPQLTYRELFKHINAMVRNMVNSQSPQIEASQESLDQPFLGGAVQAKKPHYTAYFDKAVNSWVIDGGSIHGIPAVKGQETTHLALFSTLSQEAAISLAAAKGRAEVTQVLPNLSKIKGTFDGQALDKNMTYKAVVTALPLPPLVVQMEGDEAALQKIRQALAVANEGQPSLLVKAAAEGETAEVRLTALAKEKVYRISRATDPNSLVVDTAYSEADAAALTVQRLEHIARWQQTYALTNPQTNLADDAVTLEVYTVDSEGNESRFDGADELALRYSLVDDQWKKPRLRFRLVNNTDQPLYCGLLNLSPSYRVWPVVLPGSLSVRLEPKGDAWAASGRKITMSIPDDLWQAGVTELNDLFKLIVSTAEFDATLLEQDKLPVAVEPKKAAGTRGLGSADTLSRLMRRVQTRDAGFDDEEPDFADWRTLDVSVTTIRPQEAADIAADRSVTVSETVTVDGHPSLKAKARLMTAPEASRDLGNLAVPPWLRQDPAVSQPFEMVATRSAGQPGLSVLELAEVENYEAVTPEQPLKLHVGVPLRNNEHVLPLGFDGEFFLPLGQATRTSSGVDITLERLPKPEPTRSLVGSLRIYFQKVVSETLGVKSKYPRLAVVTNENGKITYNDEAAAVKAAVANAQRVVLYIHGIIGETTGMTASAWLRTLEDTAGLTALADHYDAVLAFDYENLNTGIRQTGKALADKLKAAGLGPGHGKTFHLVAHSMGGLVSRWMIENEGGKEMVQHLFMLGTPNGGSPWSNIQDWATTALTLGLNSLAPVAWPVSIVGALLSLTERIDTMLDEMNPKSDFIKELGGSSDPGIPYTIIAGNTSIIEAAKPANGADESRIKRLLSRLSVQGVTHGVANLAFFKYPNDVAVAVDSIKNVPDDRSPAPKKQEVACDHMSYFTTEVGLRALAEAVAAT